MTKQRQHLTAAETVLLGTALRQLDSTLARFDELLASDHRWVSVEGESLPSLAIAKVRAAYNEIDGDPLPGRKAKAGCRAIVAATPKVIAAACNVNTAKADLQVACKALREKVYVGRTSCNDHAGCNRSKLSLALEAVGRPDLNVFAAYRKVPIVTGAPRRVRFSIEQFRKIYRMPRDTIASQLRNRPDVDSIEDRIRVQRLPELESSLALLSSSHPFPQVQFWFDGFDASGRSYHLMATGMPIIYVAGGVTPTVVYTGERDGPARRSPALTVCPDQYLKTMRVHRYLRYMEGAERRGR